MGVALLVRPFLSMEGLMTINLLSDIFISLVSFVTNLDIFAIVFGILIATFCLETIKDLVHL